MKIHQKQLSFLKIPALILIVFFLLLISNKSYSQICNATGNVVIYSNYDGGILNINCDVNIPNLKIGICTYEAVEVNISGAFVGNVTQVYYAGFSGTNNNCGLGITTTVINGVSPAIVTIRSEQTGNIATTNYLGEPFIPGFPAIVNCMTGADGACSTSNGGGGNSAPQIVQFFLDVFGPGSSLYSHFVDYNCFVNANFNISAGGNCCLTNTGTPLNPIYGGNGDFDLGLPTDTMLCGPSIDLNLFDIWNYQFYEQYLGNLVTPTYGFVWNTTDTGAYTSFTTPGVYVVSMTDYCHQFSGNSGVMTDTITVMPCCTQPPSPTVTGGNTYCQGSVLNNLTAVGSGGIITWYTNSSLTAQVGTGNTFTPLNTVGTTIYYVTETVAGCESTPATVTVIINPTPTVNITSSSGNTFLCPGSTLQLNSSQPTGNSWSTGSTANSITVSSPNTYSLLYTDANGCTATATITILAGTVPSATITGNTTICFGNTTSLTASGGTVVNWSTSQTSTSISVTPTTTTNYFVIVTNGQCTDTAFTTVNVLPLPSVNAGVDQTIIIGNNASLSASAAGNGTFSWNPANNLSCSNCANPLVTGLTQTTNFIVTYTLNGCSINDTVTIFVDLICGELFVPNAFSPNGDGNNDVLKIYNNCIESMELNLYDRFGTLVFKSTSQDNTFDGTYKGEPLPAQVLSYNLTVKLIGEGSKFLKGNISLLR